MYGQTFLVIAPTFLESNLDISRGDKIALFLPVCNINPRQIRTLTLKITKIILCNYKKFTRLDSAILIFHETGHTRSRKRQKNGGIFKSHPKTATYIPRQDPDSPQIGTASRQY